MLYSVAMQLLINSDMLIKSPLLTSRFSRFSEIKMSDFVRMTEMSKLAKFHIINMYILGTTTEVRENSLSLQCKVRGGGKRFCLYKRISLYQLKREIRL